MPLAARGMCRTRRNCAHNRIRIIRIQSECGLLLRPRARAPGGGLDCYRIGLAWRDEPASTYTRHRVEREPFGDRRLRNASGWTEATFVEGGGERLERRNSTCGHGGQKLKSVQAQV